MGYGGEKKQDHLLKEFKYNLPLTLQWRYVSNEKMPTSFIVPIIYTLFLKAQMLLFAVVRIRLFSKLHHNSSLIISKWNCNPPPYPSPTFTCPYFNKVFTNSCFNIRDCTIVIFKRSILQFQIDDIMLKIYVCCFQKSMCFNFNQFIVTSPVV